MSAPALPSLRALGLLAHAPTFAGLGRAFLGLSAGVLLSVSGCTRAASEDAVSSPGGKVCTQIGCLDGFRIALEPAGGMPAGAYTFAVEIDGALTTCEGSLPLAACEAGPSVTCSSDAVAIGESGCAMDPASQSFSDVIFQAPNNPEAVKLTISRDGAVIGEGEFSPEYRRVQPNGPECAPTCEQAEATLELTGS